MHPSTDKKTLLKLKEKYPQHSKLLQNIIDWRTLSQVINNYYNVLPDQSFYDPISNMDRVYPTILLTSAGTFF